MNRMVYLLINALLVAVDLSVSRFSHGERLTFLMFGLLGLSFCGKWVVGYYRALNIGDKAIWKRWFGAFLVLILLSGLARTQPAVPGALSIVVVVLMIVVLVCQLQLLFLPSLESSQRSA